MLAKHCLEEFKLDCQLRRLTDRTIKGYYNNTLNFLTYAEKHHGIPEAWVNFLHSLFAYCIIMEICCAFLQKEHSKTGRFPPS